MLGIGVVFFGLGLVMAPLLGLVCGLVAAFSGKPRSVTSLFWLFGCFAFPAVLLVVFSFLLSSVPVPLLTALRELLLVVVLFLVPAFLALAVGRLIKKLAACFRSSASSTDHGKA